MVHPCHIYYKIAQNEYTIQKLKESSSLAYRTLKQQYLSTVFASHPFTLSSHVLPETEASTGQKGLEELHFQTTEQAPQTQRHHKTQKPCQSNHCCCCFFFFFCLCFCPTSTLQMSPTAFQTQTASCPTFSL